MVEFTGARVADLPTVEVSTWVDAAPERVWDVVSDVTRMPATSSELQSVEWLDDGPGAVGSRFVGHNHHEALGSWSTTSYVVESERPSAFAWAVEDVENPNSTWRFGLSSRDGGTDLTYRVRMGPGRSGLSQAIERMPDKEAKIVFNRLTEFEKNMTRTLEALKVQAETADSTTHA